MKNNRLARLQALRIGGRRLLLPGLILCALCLIAGATLTFYVAQGTAFNVISTPVLQIALRETTTDGLPYPEEGVSGLMPGTQLDKRVWVENTGSVEAYVRVGISLRMNDTLMPMDNEAITLDIDTDHWTHQKEGADDFYYYNEALGPGGQTSALFTQAAVSGNLPNRYKRARLEIVVTVQAVQASDNGTNALDATGYGLEQEGESGT